jgi:hypothetical protein
MGGREKSCFQVLQFPFTVFNQLFNQPHVRFEASAGAWQYESGLGELWTFLPSDHSNGFNR